MAKSRHHHHHRHDSKAKKITIYSLAAINCIIVILMLISSYSGTLPPQDYPKLSLMPLLFPIFLLLSVICLVAWLFIRKKFSLISAVGLLLCISDIRGYVPINIQSNAPQGSIKVMSFNIGKVKKDNVKDFVNYIDRISPDVLCMQECLRSLNLEEDTTIRQLYPYIKYNKDKGATVACFSRYPIVRSESIEYGGKGNATAAFYLMIGNEEVLFVNNHLQSYSLNPDDIKEYKDITGRSADISEREKGTKNIAIKIRDANKLRGPQVDTICQYLEKNAKQYTVVMGDFNEPTMSYAHYRFTKNYNDAFTRAGNGFGFTYSRDKIFFRIDHILYSEKMDAFETEVDKTCTISDHYPIFCYLKME